MAKREAVSISKLPPGSWFFFAHKRTPPNKLIKHGQMGAHVRMMIEKNPGDSGSDDWKLDFQVISAGTQVVAIESADAKRLEVAYLNKLQRRRKRSLEKQL